jgi:hypothetical protein
MRFHVGAIPLNPDFHPGEGWTPLKEPTPWMFQLLAMPVAFLNAGVFGYLWCALTPLLKTSMPGTDFFKFVALIPVLIVLHEFVHAWVHPQAGRSPRSIVGVWPSRILFYAHYDGEVTRNRFLLIFLMPLAVLSAAPLVLASLFQIASPVLAALSICNATFACGDVFGAGLLLWQLPATTITRNHGWVTYWRTAPR